MVITYTLYLILSLAITFWVGHLLFTNGRVFLIGIFEGNVSLADSVNRLMIVGYYLVNAAFVTLTLKTADRAIDLASSIEILSSKVGLVMLVLGIWHFFNLFAFSCVRRYDVVKRFSLA
jgi:hypothetical protein